MEFIVVNVTNDGRREIPRFIYGLSKSKNCIVMGKNDTNYLFFKKIDNSYNLEINEFDLQKFQYFHQIDIIFNRGNTFI